MLQKSLPAEAAEAEVCQAQRMEIVGQLTGGVVHDFNNILTVITGTIEILAESVADRPDLAAIAGLIAEAAARGGNLTSHLLAFARGQRSPPREVDVNALLVDATRLLRPTLGDQIEVDTKPAADVSPAWIDPSLLMTAILNLAILARDAMPEGGKLTFETRDSADHVVIAASAFGYGISAGRRDLAFVDLCMAHDLIRPSDGQIDCIGTGYGTSVEIRLPRAAGVARLPAEESSNAQVEGGDEAILVV